MARATLAPFLTTMQGKFGTASFSKGKGGVTNMRPRVKPANPRTAAQNAARGAQGKSAQTFKNFPSAVVTVWKAYAATLPQVSKKTGAKITVQGINAYCQLADKFLQVNPTGTPPTTPPTSAFLGDAITLTCTAGTGQVTFTASGANAAGVTTELLLQPLKGRNRKPAAKYTSKGFKAFAVGSLTQILNLPTGFYAAAYRFVNVATGQMTALVPIGVQTVALSVEDGGLGEDAFDQQAA